MSILTSIKRDSQTYRFSLHLLQINAWGRTSNLKILLEEKSFLLTQSNIMCLIQIIQLRKLQHSNTCNTVWLICCVLMIIFSTLVLFSFIYPALMFRTARKQHQSNHHPAAVMDSETRPVDCSSIWIAWVVASFHPGNWTELQSVSTRKKG